ncbi:MFS transporter [Lacrimispora sp. JR3]|uniref:MFS transporter n=1 Tax=Lacrimispora sinapis TaxID=3111456 RepID=UPI003749B688
MQNKQIAAPVILVSFPSIIFGGLLPLYTERLHFTTLELTMLYSVFALSGLIMKLIIGFMSDRFSRRFLLLLSLSVYGVAYLALSGAETIPQLVAARFIQGAAGILLNISVMGLILDGNASFAQSIGAFHSNCNFGGMIGVGVAFLIFSKYDLMSGWKLFFLCSAGAAVLGFLCCLPNVKRTEKTPVRHLKPVAFTKEKQKLWFFNLFLCLFLSIPQVLLIPFLKASFDLDMIELATVFFLPMVVSSILGPYLGRLGDTLGYRKVIVLSSILAAAMAIAVVVFHDLSAFQVLWTAYVMSTSALDYSLDAMFVKGINEHVIGDYYGRYTFGSSIGHIIGPVIGGSLFDLWGKDVPYLVFSVLMLLYALCAAVLLPEIRSSKREECGSNL